MDTRTAKVDVSAKIEEIKQYMPETYKSIQAKSVEVGNVAYEWVRRGLRGEANCFYAFERGRVVGEPFKGTGVMDEVAGFMVNFGVLHCVVWARLGAVNGAH